jgi:beta-glucosidase
MLEKLLSKSFKPLALALLLTLAGFAVTARAQAPVAGTPALDAKAHAMVAKLTLEQKIELIGGVDSMFTNAEPTIGLPRLKMSDASVGVRTWGPTTAYAGGAALAATWDRGFARRLGESLGRDARARGVNFLLGPGVNIARSPVSGRNFEYLSEDPYLNGQLVAPWIEGVQSEGVIATVKHYAVNDQEYNRHNVDVTVDERTLREIYLPSFEAAIKAGHVDAVMDSYNLINGSHATQNQFLNVQVLRKDWGFEGVVMSDWDATYDAVGAANNGLDLEMPGPRFMNAKNLLAAIKDGRVKEATIDEKCFRIVRTALRYGFENHAQFDAAAGTYNVGARKVALEGALESITLLKNEKNFLPLDAAKTKTVAVIGPDGWPAVVGGGGSSQAEAFAPVSLVTGIGDLLGANARVLFNRGLPEMTDVFGRTKWASKVEEATFPSKDCTGTPVTTEVEAISNYKAEWWGPENKSPRSLRYTASYKALKAGKYLVLAAASGSDHYKVSVDGKQILDQPQFEGQFPEFASIELTADQTVKFVADYLPGFEGNRFGLGVIAESELVTEEAKQYAKAADVVVLAVGYGPSTESEGGDRSFGLPWGQDALVEAIEAINPHAIVAITSGGAVDTRRWLDKTPALLQLWYPGQEGGTAAAEVLFGKHTPEGRLPVSYDRAWEESPSYKYYDPIAGADTTLDATEVDGRISHYVSPHVKYDDGLMVGYRYWTTEGKKPLFPFGYGLSYTSFKFANLTAPKTAKAGEKVEVGFDVTNTGKAAGAEVAQLYISDPSATVKRPERELKGFEKVRLEPGATKHVTLSLDARAFSYWDEASRGWKIDPGKFVVRVGSSSEETPLSAELTLIK